ncbi:MAG: hypothetical protein HC845_09500 [Akkermansiaceae bacterium]|nr:hypothetical protein [Akkermansiaceae bacterium]
MDLDDVKDAVSMPVEMAQVGEFPSIPTVSSGLVQLEAKLNSILTKVDSLDLQGTVAKIGPLADEFKLAASDSRKTMMEIGDASAAARKMIESFNSPEFAKLPTDLKKTLTALEKSVASIGPDGAIQGDLLRTMDELRGTLRSLNSLATGLDDKPNSLLFGRETSGNPVPKAPKN